MAFISYESSPTPVVRPAVLLRDPEHLLLGVGPDSEIAIRAYLIASEQSRHLFLLARLPVSTRFAVISSAREAPAGAAGSRR